MLFKMTQLDAVAAGKITVAYRRWTRPTVKKGGTLRTPACILAIDDVTKLPKSARITKADAAAAGFASVQALKDVLSDEGDLYRVTFHPAGVDERATLRTTVATSQSDIDALAKALAKLDARKPWTLDTLALIEAHPATLAAKLADKVGREKLDFKDGVRKLKGLGLTESLDVGYRLSPRGLAWLERARPDRVRPVRDASARLPDDIIAALTRAKIMGVRAGETHTFVGVWPVVVDGHLYARSWSAGQGGWWRAFVALPKREGAVHVQLIARGTKTREVDLLVRAVPANDEAILDAIDAEYRRKYKTPGALPYVTDLCANKSRATTVELVPR